MMMMMMCYSQINTQISCVGKSENSTCSSDTGLINRNSAPFRGPAYSVMYPDCYIPGIRLLFIMQLYFIIGNNYSNINFYNTQ